jgi:hypothetical protein
LTRDGAAATGPELVETKREPASSATYPIDLFSTIDRRRFYRLPATVAAGCPATGKPYMEGAKFRPLPASSSDGSRYMTTFDKREEGFEKKFALDEEQKFKAEVRRNRLLGQWAAEKLGLSGDEATAYAKEVVNADFDEAGDGDVLRKVEKDFAAKGLGIAAADIRAKMNELLAEAAAQVKAGK